MFRPRVDRLLSSDILGYRDDPWCYISRPYCGHSSRWKRFCAGFRIHLWRFGLAWHYGPGRYCRSTSWLVWNLSVGDFGLIIWYDDIYQRWMKYEGLL